MSIEKNNVNSTILIVLIAGILWSFGSLTVRFIEDAHLVPWQYLFFRGSTIFLLLNIYLFFKEGKSFTHNYKKIGLSGIIGGTSLGSCHDDFHLVNYSYFCSSYTFDVGCNAFYDSYSRLYFS